MLTLIRGLPGSGKTTYTKALTFSICCKHVETDHYWVRPDGTYDWNPKLLKQAHKWAQEKVEEYLRQGLDVYVSNTFIKVEHIQPYIEMAVNWGHSIAVIECKRQFGNIHGVPETTVEKMKSQWEEIPNEMLQEIFELRVVD